MAQNWFKHDYGARNDDNILELRAEYGWKGYGLFYAFIETMAENEKGAIDLDKIGGLSIGYNLPKEELLAFVDTCLEIGLFYKDEEGLVRNTRITKHVEKLKSYREAGRKGAEKRWSNNSDKGANRGGNETPNADKSRVDKSRKEQILVQGKAFDEKAKIFDIINEVDLEKEPESKQERISLMVLHIWSDVNNLQPNNQITLNAKLKTWHDPVRLMIEQDNRTLKEIWKVWKHVQQDQFWKSNVLSTSKLREQFDKLRIKFNQNGESIDAVIDSLYR